MVLPVFFVVLLFGHVAETVGPLPFDMSTCRAHAKVDAQRLDALFADRAKAAAIPPMPDGRRITRHDVETHCSHQRPALS